METLFEYMVMAIKNSYRGYVNDGNVEAVDDYLKQFSSLQDKISFLEKSASCMAKDIFSSLVIPSVINKILNQLHHETPNLKEILAKELQLNYRCLANLIYCDDEISLTIFTNIINKKYGNVFKNWFQAYTIDELINKAANLINGEEITFRLKPFVPYLEYSIGCVVLNHREYYVIRSNKSKIEARMYPITRKLSKEILEHIIRPSDEMPIKDDMVFVLK